MKKIQYILLASLAIGAGASAASLPEEAAAMAEQFLSQKMGGKTADGGSLTAAVMSTSDKAVKKTKSLKKAEFYAYNAPQGGFVLMSANGDDLRVMGYSTDAGCRSTICRKRCRNGWWLTRQPQPLLISATLILRLQWLRWLRC